jgi:hypothetical protein
MGGQGLMGNITGNNAVVVPNYGQQPMGANLGVSTADMGFGQAPSNPDLSKLNMTGMSYTNEQPIGGFAAPAYFPNPSYVAPTNNEQPVGDVFTTMQPPRTGDYGSGPMAMGNFGGINSLVNPSATQNQYTNNLNTAGTNFQSQYGTNPYVQAAQATTAGNIQGAQAATAANRVNQTTPFGSLTYTQTGVDANGNPTWSANQSYTPEVANTLSQLSGQFGQNIAGGFNPQLPSYGINPNEAYTDAIMRRLEPVQQRQQQQLETRLANQGIMRGSEAYNNAMTDFAQKQNDQLTSAVVGGMQTGLQANQQAYNQALQNYNLPLTQLGSYRTATAPTYINPYTQAAVAGPDLTGAYTSSIAAEIEKQKADAAQQAALTGGLFQLGGSVLSNPTATSSLGGIINKGIGAVGDVFSGLF